MTTDFKYSIEDIKLVIEKYEKQKGYNRLKSAESYIRRKMREAGCETLEEYDKQKGKSRYKGRPRVHVQ